MGRRVLEQRAIDERRPLCPSRKTTASWSTSSSQLGRGSRPGSTRGRNSSPCASGDDFAIRIRTEAWTAVFRCADDDRVIAAEKKGAPNVMVCAMQHEQAGSFSLKKSGSEKAHRLAFEWMRRMQWLYDTYVTQDDEAFEYSDAHFGSYLHAADWEAFLCTLPGTDSVRLERPSAPFVLCRQYAIVVRVTR